MFTDTITATYGNAQTPCTVFTFENKDGGTWYAVEGSLNVNCTHAELADGVDVETLEDFDSFTAGTKINSEEELINQVES